MTINLFKGRAAQHLGYLVDDVDRMHRLLGDSLGVRVTEPREIPITVDIGEPATLRTMLAQIGETLYEFIQPRGGYWADALAERGPGVHHVAYTLGDAYEEAVETVTALGFRVLVAGRFGELSRWCYVESDGLVLELSSGRGPQLDGPPRPAS